MAVGVYEFIICPSNSRPYLINIAEKNPVFGRG